MNNSKIWLVVNPTVGIPLLLSAVAISSFAVHLALVSNTDWIEQYHQGGADAEAMAARDAETDVQTAGTARHLRDGDRLQVVLPDGTTAWAVIEAPDAKLASVVPRRD